MTDADLVYAALLRAERRLEELRENTTTPELVPYMATAHKAVQVIREEIGTGLAREGR